MFDKEQLKAAIERYEDRIVDMVHRHERPEVIERERRAQAKAREWLEKAEKRDAQ